jgi:O-antigen/teichoic acid export membrane protein
MTIIVIRILTPEDYGLMAMAMVCVSFLMLVNELGMGAVLVQRSTMEDSTRANIFALTLLINATFFTAMFFASPLIADFFREPRLVVVLRTLCFLFLIYAFEIVPVAQLERELDFKRKSIVYLVANVSGGVVTLTAALSGFGVWSLVSGTVCIALIRTAGVNLVAPVLLLPRMRMHGLRDLIRFGGLVTAERAMWFFYTQVDIFIVGKVLGKTSLGYYTVAMNLASLIMHKTGGVLYEVSFPTFARTQDQAGRARAYFLKGTRVISFIAFPIFFGISSVAPEIVDVLLGAKWQPASTLLAVLALVMPLRMISNLFPPALQGLGRPDISVGNLGVAMILMPFAFLIGTRWGILGVSAAWVVAFPIIFAIMFYRSREVLNIEIGEFVQAMRIPCLASGVMYIVVVSVRHALPESLPAVADLGALVAIGAGTYSVLVWTYMRETCHEVMALTRR